PVDFQSRLGRLDPRRRFVHGRLVLVQLLLADAAGHGTGNRLIALVGGLRQPVRGLVQVDLPLGLIELSLVRARIDLEENFSFLDFRSFLEGDAYNVASDTGANAHGFHGIGPAGVVDVVGHFSFHGPARRHYRQLSRSNVSRTPLTAD